MKPGTGWRVRTVVASLLIPPAIHLVPLNVLSAQLVRRSRRRTAATPPDPDSTAWRVDRVLNALPWPWRHTCLKRAATLFYLLRRSGHPVELRVGVRREKGKALEAHAWLTLRGEPFLEAPAAQIATYSPIASFGSEG